MSAGACLTDDQLAAWAEGAASEAEVSAMTGHLAGCTACRTVLSELARADGARPPPLALGRYQLQERVGQGGMGTVFAAWDPTLGRRVAVKLLTAAPSDQAGRAQRFLHERRVLAGLEHPHIARLFDAGETDDGRPYFVMELVDGQPLDVFCDARRLTIRQRVELLLPVLGAVSHAHRQRVVHRDLKPGNILVTAEGVPKLLDFGLARLLHTDPGLTAVGVAPMTPAYASPEQARREAPGTASDLYALGVVLHELLSGVSPYQASGVEALLRAIQQAQPEPLSRAVARATEASVACRGASSREALAKELQGPLEDLVATALRKDPARRQSSVEALAAELEAWLGGAAPTTQTPRPAPSASLHDTHVPSSQAAPLQRALAHRYELVRTLGQGGMATVYLAREHAQDRYVAVKVLRPELADGPAAARFAREVAVLRRLDHPHILGLHEAGEVEGWQYFTMPLVTGESLRERVRREGQLRLEEVVRLATQLASALDHAHQRGVVHRDVKPENILLSGARALLADFGVAKLMAPAVALEDAATLEAAFTAAGHVVGTPTYMSPEQVAGDVRLDLRSDVYALGVVVYELLVGEPPFSDGTAAQLMARHLSESPVPPRQRLPDVPASHDEAVMRALAKDPAHRFATAGDLAAALAGESLGAAGRARRASTVQLVAVLDFEDLTPAAELGWLGTGLAETVAAELGQLKGLRVVPRDRLHKLAPDALGIADEEAAFAIGAAVGARWVVWGTYQSSGRSVRIHQRMAEVTARSASAPVKTDGPVDDLFLLQDRVVDAVVTALAVKRSHPTLAEGPARDPAALSAYEHHARGRQAFLRGGPKAFAEAWGHYRRALELDPRHARALAGLGAICCFRFVGSGQRDELDLALKLLGQALAIDPGLGEAHLWSGYALGRLHRYGEAVPRHLRATELDPGNAFAHYALGAATLTRGVDEHRWEHFARAIPPLVRAIELEPGSVAPYFALGLIYLLQGDYLHATGVLERAVELESRGRSTSVRLPGAAVLLASLERRRGEDAAAAARLREALPRYEADERLYATAFTALTRCELGLLAERAGRHGEALGQYLAGAALCEAHAGAVGTGGLLVRARLGMARCYARLGQAAAQRAAFEAAWELFSRHEGPGFDSVWGSNDAFNQLDFARYHALVGEEALAVDSLRTAVDWGWGDLPDLERDPVFAALRATPAVQALVSLVRSREPLPGYPPSLVGATPVPTATPAPSPSP